MKNDGNASAARKQPLVFPPFFMGAAAAWRRHATRCESGSVRSDLRVLRVSVVKPWTRLQCGAGFSTRSEPRDADLLPNPQAGTRLTQLEGRGALQRLLVERGAHPLAADVVADLFDRVRVAVKRELAVFLPNEPSARDRCGERDIGSGVARVRPDEIVDVADAAHADDARREQHLQMRRFGGWTDVNEISCRAQPSVCTLQGIDHALTVDSSQGPRKQDDVK